MTETPWPNALTQIRRYLNSQMTGILFIAFDRPCDIQELLKEMTVCDKIHMSSFCRPDSTPGFDAWQETIKNSNKNLLLTGIGEHLALTGDTRFLRHLWALRRECLPIQIIAPIWNGYDWFEMQLRACASDSHAGRMIFLPREGPSWRIKRYLMPHQAQLTGFRSILARLEKGFSGELKAATVITPCPEFCESINSYYQIYLEKHPSSRLAQQTFSEKQWREFVIESGVSDYSFFGAGTFRELKENGADNAWLQYVSERTASHSQFRDNFLQLFLEIGPDQRDFARLARDRKKLLKNLSETDQQEYVILLRSMAFANPLPWLGDANLPEKQEILRYLKNNPEVSVAAAFPDLELYRQDYKMPDCSDAELDALLTDYFNVYKKAKLKNEILPELELLVKEQAGLKTFLRLPTRGDLLGGLDAGNTQLFWLDSMGCEFLGFISGLAREMGLAMNVKIGRASLPTITSVNSGFYQEWQGPKRKVAELDAIKHGESQNRKEAKFWPLHLANELEVIRKVMLDIAAVLTTKACEAVILTSDHGATRMAILSDKLEAWQMPESGKHGGRCCRVSDAASFKPSVASNDNPDWYALADYSRFKGSRTGSVEAHGGATLEEVLTPVIRLSLQKRLPKINRIGAWQFRILPKDVHITLRLSSNEPLANPVLRFANQDFPLSPLDRDYEYEVKIPTSLARIENNASVYNEGEKIAENLNFTVSRGMRSSGLDDFF